MYRENKQTFKVANHLPKKLLRTLQEENDRRLKRFAQLRFAMHYHKQYMECVKQNNGAGTLN